MSEKKDSWGSRVGLILAMAGNAVGLGNFLRFPVQAVQNGGGQFIIPYLICFVVMGIPLLWIEWTMGRFGGRFGNHSTPYIMDNFSKKRYWKYIGVFGIFTNIGVASYYCYIESWTLSYVFHSLFGTFHGMSNTDVAAFFGDYVSIDQTTSFIPYEAVVLYIICLALNTYILSQGLQGGVEKVAKIGVPMLLIFGAFLAFRGLTMGAPENAPADCTDCNAFLGINYLWAPPDQFSSLFEPKVWLAAAGQIFFTCSVGMGTIHCYASYVSAKDDIALNAMSAGWMNGFVEVVLGASVIIPIAAGYLGLEWVKENAGFSMAFETMPYLFDQWGVVLGVLAGVFWFGLLFFAGITSSLAMGTPWMGFMRDEFGWGQKKAAWSFGGLILLVGLPTVFLFKQGVFDEYDYWAGTVSLVVFATFETVLFAWIFGINRGWDELNQGADIKIPIIFKYFMVYLTPIFLLIILGSSLVQPKGGDWDAAFSGQYELDNNSILGKIMNKGVKHNSDWFAEEKESEVAGEVMSAGTNAEGKLELVIGESARWMRSKGEILPYDKTLAGEAEAFFDSLRAVQTYEFEADKQLLVKPGDVVAPGTPVAGGGFVNDIFWVSMARLLLVVLFIFICGLVYVAYHKRKREGRMNP